MGIESGNTYYISLKLPEVYLKLAACGVNPFLFQHHLI